MPSNESSVISDVTRNTSSINERQLHNLELALEYASAGIPVFPCKDGSKIGNNGKPDRAPYTRHGFKDATTDKKMIQKLWHKYPSAVPGIPTGSASGLAVLDVDCKNGKNGRVALARIGFDVEDPAARIVETPSGGLHLIYNHQEGLTNSDSHLRAMGVEGVEIRAEGGFVFAPGAKNALGEYRARSGDFFFDKLIGFRNFPDELRPPERRVDRKASAQGKNDLSLLRRALSFIPNDLPHDDWVKVMAAVHHETGGSKEGIAVINGWSAGYVGWSSKEVRQKWLSFGRSDGPRVTGGTLLRLAGEFGFKNNGVGPDDFLDVAVDDEPTLQFLSTEECATLPPADYLVRDIIGPGQVGCVFGEPGAGKSVLAPFLGYSIANGGNFFGQTTREGQVWYIAGEDELGMARRVASLAAERGNTENFSLIRGVSDLFSRGVVEGAGSRDFQELLKKAEDEKPKLIVIDTLASVMPGLEENSAEGMSRVVQIGRAFAKLGATVIYVHHGTKNEGSTPRGHSVLNGALDFSIMVKKANADGVVRCIMAKNRNGPPDLDIAFRIGSLETGEDIDGNPLSAPICEPCSSGPTNSEERITKSSQAAFDVLEEIGGRDQLIAKRQWKEACVEGTKVSASDKIASRETAFNRAKAQLTQKGRVVEDGDFFRLAHVFDEYDEEGNEE